LYVCGERERERERQREILLGQYNKSFKNVTEGMPQSLSFTGMF
jgi:hypothetical protein